MRRLLRYRPSAGVVLGFIALFVALSGTAAALSGVNVVFKDDIAPNAVGRSEILRGGVAKSEIARDSVGQSEAREDNDRGGGFTGKQINEATLGPVPKANGMTDWAVVASNGALVRSSNVNAAAKVQNPGRYQVTFNRNVAGCAYLATLGGTGNDFPIRGEIYVASQPGNANAVRVATRNANGNFADRPFHLAVSC